MSEISITQEILNNVSSGTHTLRIEVESASGFSASDSTTFYNVSTPQVMVDSDLGEFASGFDFDITLFGINESATVYGYIDNALFYMLNYGMDDTYKVKVGNTTMYALGGGEHEMKFTVTDEYDKTSEAMASFRKKRTVPQVIAPTSIGDKTGAFAVTFSIKNAASEKPSLAAYMDTVTEPFYSASDASNINTVTIDADLFESLDTGAHSVILAITNEAGSTVKSIAFSKTTPDTTFAGLKLGYDNDAWDGTKVEDRIYTLEDVEYEGNTYKSIKDETPYDTEGEMVTGNLLAAISRGVQNANATNITRGMDGSYTETSKNGTSVLTKTDNGYVEVFTDKEGNTLTKNVYINADGTISESTTFKRAQG